MNSLQTINDEESTENCLNSFYDGKLLSRYVNKDTLHKPSHCQWSYDFQNIIVTRCPMGH